MLVSYKWLQTYFEKPLPAPEKLADILTMGVFEIESMEKVGVNGAPAENADADTVLDVKVLPDRAGYCLSHRYIAQEIGALIGEPVKFPKIGAIDVQDTTYVFNASIENPDLCRRYVTRVIENIEVTDSPEWLRTALETLGQRSINAIVDLTNYLMIETGQPLHVFDADKVEGDIVIRNAKAGETVRTLDGKIINLETDMLVIADSVGPLDIAGIKGGKKAELTRDTKRIMTSASCFDAVSIRKTAQKTGVRTDASKRFENGLTPERAALAETMLASHIAALQPAAIVGAAIDVYPNPVAEKSLEVSVQKINTRLALELSAKRMQEILTSIDIECAIREADQKGQNENSGEELLLSIPLYRADLNITEDIAEEIGRIYGLTQIEGVPPKKESNRRINKNLYYQSALRKALTELGFSESYTYGLTDAGETPLANPLTVERAYLRDSISHMLSRKFLFNMKNADLLGVKDIRMFEIGKIFSGGVDKERFSLAYGIARNKNPKGHDAKGEIIAVAKYLVDVLKNIADEIDPTDTTTNTAAVTEADMKFTELSGDAQTPCVGAMVEFDLDPIIAKLPEPKEDFEMPPLPQIKFMPISAYPFSVRDIAVFVPGEQSTDTELRVSNIIFNSLNSEQKSLVVRTTLFDVFTKRKEGEPVKTSYAYRLVFQSSERTLTEEEVIAAVKTVTEALAKEEGFEVR